MRGAWYAASRAADTRRGEREREWRHGSSGCHVSPRFGRPCRVNGGAGGWTGVGEVGEVKGVESLHFYHGFGPVLKGGRKVPIRCSTVCLFEVLILF